MPLLCCDWGCSSVGTASDPHAAEAGSTPWCDKGFFSYSQLSVQTLVLCPYSPCIKLHALTAVCMLEIPSTGSHAFGQMKIPHTLVGMARAALAAAVVLPR